MSRQIYLDYNASTPVHSSVAEAMRAALDSGYGNPSSLHWAGAPAKATLEHGRGQVAALLGCSSREIVFTSGGSEANNLALKGVLYARRGPTHVITTRIEHPSVLAPCAFLERQGARVTRLAVDGTGLVDPDEVRRAIAGDTALISIMHANNEVSTIEPIEACARIAREQGILFHTDAAQSVGKIATRVDELGVDLLSIAGHKLYAPKGVGALYVRAGMTLEPLIHGAGHESGRRAGTESAMLAAGLGAACAIAADLAAMEPVRGLRDRLWDSLRARFAGRVVLNGHRDWRLPNTLNVSFIGQVGAEILAAMPGVAASTGSACHAGHIELSPVLAAMGVEPTVGVGAIRFSLGRATTEAEVDEVVSALASFCKG
ncbi:MAG: cysteine desulfurase [Gammaproteobacteria bacterium]|nr:cysteine desulfurase [Gammaproteobacteria bacterium]